MSSKCAHTLTRLGLAVGLAILLLAGGPAAAAADGGTIYWTVADAGLTDGGTVGW